MYYTGSPKLFDHLLYWDKLEVGGQRETWTPCIYWLRHAYNFIPSVAGELIIQHSNIPISSMHRAQPVHCIILSSLAIFHFVVLSFQNHTFVLLRIFCKAFWAAFFSLFTVMSSQKLTQFSGTLRQALNSF